MRLGNFNISQPSGCVGRLAPDSRSGAGRFHLIELCIRCVLRSQRGVEREFQVFGVDRKDWRAAFTCALSVTKSAVTVPCAPLTTVMMSLSTKASSVVRVSRP